MSWCTWNLPTCSRFAARSVGAEVVSVEDADLALRIAKRLQKIGAQDSLEGAG